MSARTIVGVVAMGMLGGFAGAVHWGLLLLAAPAGWFWGVQLAKWDEQDREEK